MPIRETDGFGVALYVSDSMGGIAVGNLVKARLNHRTVYIVHDDTADRPDISGSQ